MHEWRFLVSVSWLIVDYVPVRKFCIVGCDESKASAVITRAKTEYYKQLSTFFKNLFNTLIGDLYAKEMSLVSM